MCGIAGILSPHPQLVSVDRLKMMTDAIAHRGPDGEGQWINDAGTTGLGNRRLAVIDLSPAGAQPMHYRQRYTIVHNGEIYNYIEIRNTLQQKGYSFISGTDTEVILAAYDCWKDLCLQYFDGMFAFAVWDEQEKMLFAARDRFGEKPFYYYMDERQFIFASEIKALWACGVEKMTDERMLLQYLSAGHVQSTIVPGKTFYKNIFKLPPAHYLTIEPGKLKKSTVRYWYIDKNNKVECTETDAIEKLKELLNNSVNKRLRSDAPVGTSLSGGLDSSCIALNIKNVQPGRECKSFSAVFPGFEKDESEYIKQVCDSLHLKNYQTAPTANDFIRDFEKMMHHHDEPADSASIYAQYKVFELAKVKNITVLLDGQGADEILAGYHKYYHWFWQELYHANNSLYKRERGAAKQLHVTSEWGWKNKLAARFPQKAAKALEKREYDKMRNDSFLDKDFIKQFGTRDLIYKPVVRSLNDILHFNTFQSGLEELLRYADCNSMAHGREIRLPFLDHELVSYVFSLPSTFKIHDGWTKWILRKSMETRLPNDIVWRKDKTGFEPPQKQWMQNKPVQDYIQQAKEKLVGKKILSKSVLIKKIQPQDAYAADNYDWRWLIASCFL